MAYTRKPGMYELDADDLNFIAANFDDDGRCFNPNFCRKPKFKKLLYKCAYRQRQCPYLGHHYELIGMAATFRAGQKYSRILGTPVVALSG